MLEGIREDVEASVAPLLRGIVDDTQRLVKQELALARVEVAQEAARARAAAIGLGVGTAALLLATVLMAFMAVYLIAAYVDGLPLWVSFGVVGVVAVLIAAFSMIRAVRKLRAIQDDSHNVFNQIWEDFRWIQRKV
jgi:hypothetical protein